MEDYGSTHQDTSAPGPEPLAFVGAPGTARSVPGALLVHGDEGVMGMVVTRRSDGNRWESMGLFWEFHGILVGFWWDFNRLLMSVDHLCTQKHGNSWSWGPTSEGPMGYTNSGVSKMGNLKFRLTSFHGKPMVLGTPYLRNTQLVLWRFFAIWS